LMSNKYVTIEYPANARTYLHHEWVGGWDTRGGYKAISEGEKGMDVLFHGCLQGGA